MAGSWNHIVDKKTGKLLGPTDANMMLENGGDWWEFAEEAYGMVWWLSSQLSGLVGQNTPGEIVEFAQQNYRAGIEVSPGTDGHLDDEEGE